MSSNHNKWLNRIFLSLCMIHIWTYQSPITLLQLFFEHSAESNLIHLQVKLYYTQRRIVDWDQHFPSVYWCSEYVPQRESNSYFIFLGALQSPWHLFKMTLYRHTAVERDNFSVTHWVTEALQAQRPALVKNILKGIYPNLKWWKRRTQHGKFNSITMCTWNRIGFSFMIYLYQHTSEREDSAFPLHTVCILHEHSSAWHIIGSSEPWAYF